ncbi:LysM peptidoglycan-binding domain-containing protein [Sporolactobacillus spathodeae]|uniref:LysM repeat protein n=1 Tax=Sporolactobacillus spathodeae TaxID=1465502 RepID=A0ABS2Q559_9BACL|nr:LysM repeat protein [Sporolactobacillus spathodeae]
MKKLVVPAALVGGVLFSATGQQAFAASGQDIVTEAMNYQGVPYSYGAPAFSTSSFDCSSFTQYIFNKVYGITLPRNSAQQATQGVAVSTSSLQSGDLLFFDTEGDGGIHHVGIYIGNGQMISAELTVGVHVTNVFSGGGSQNYWQPRFVSARRVVPTSSAASVSQAPSSVNTAAVSQSSVASTSQSAAVYKVKSGDTLWKIAKAHGTSVAALQSANGLKSDMIYPGQKLKLSRTAKTPATSTPSVSVSLTAAKTSVSSTVSSNSSGAIYKVKSGDSLWKIARTHRTTVQSIKSLNSLTSDRIYVGQQLKLSGSSSGQTVVQADLHKAASDSTSYVVKGGDSLWEISMLQNISVNQLMKANNLTSTLIYPGMRLVIPQ